eukprot:6675135-Prymnesium_polylepis.2
MSEPESESPYSGAFGPKTRRLSRESTAASPKATAEPSVGQQPPKSFKSPYSGSFKGTSDSDSESSDDDSTARPASAKRGSSRQLRTQRANARSATTAASDGALRHMMCHLFMANVILVLVALLWVDRGAFTPIAAASMVLVVAGFDALAPLWKSPLLSLLLLTASTAALML